ncbi:hypothetical protein D1610_13870 [Sphingomonas gilva]|uniref:Uncharacterized protein n=1 Tax=Sphingomonas gilva TaxID=2305907 RepID=A0A396RKL2_9SPHN|nr:Mth938-like domain-containing protein [Sphingomonas gilva]RHW16808.1 hypothetical protein D1610_13870 [Sphingomonas gilva]
MDPDQRPQGPLIRGFASGGFRVDDTLCSGALAITPLWAREWAAPAIDALTASDVADLIGIDPPPEFLLLGTGATLKRPSPAFTAALEARGIGVEPMDSRAAARAWGMVRGEGRWIAGALYPLDA